MITLICYKKNDLNNFLTYGIYYKSYEDEINLRNLPTSSSITSGYKLANMVDPITNKRVKGYEILRRKNKEEEI